MSDDTPRFSTDRYDDRDLSYNDEVYESADGNRSADNIDPKRLVSTPSVDDIRWYCRNGPIAPTIVEKPVDDAFKNGYDIDNEQKQEFIEEIEGAFREAHRKARRDGFALIWFRLVDTSHEWEPPSGVQELHEAKVLTLDDMTTAKPLAFEEKISAGNQDNFRHSGAASVGTTQFEQVNSLSDLVEIAENDDSLVEEHSIGDGDEAETLRRIVRDSEDPRQLATDRLNDPDIDPEDVSGRMPYGRSRFYETTDNGIVLSRRMDDTRFEKPIGYLYGRGAAFDPLLIHHSRVFHVTWRGDVDGPVNREAWGGWEGDSILRPVIHLLRHLHKSNWSLGQNLFRHSSPLHVLSYEEGMDEETLDKGERAVDNITAKSSITEPPGFELRSIESDSEAPIDETYDVFFDQLSAAAEMPRSVLFGTQAGTVSGSETDAKTYYNMVERLRTSRFADELKEIVNWYAGLDANDYEFDEGLPIEWGPLFRLDELDKAERLSRLVQTVKMSIDSFIMTPDEARTILQEEWEDADIDWTEDFSEEEQEFLASLNVAQMGAEAGIETISEGSEAMQGNPRRGQNGGGREQGDNGSSRDPSTE